MAFIFIFMALCRIHRALKGIHRDIESYAGRTAECIGRFDIFMALCGINRALFEVYRALKGIHRDFE